HEVGRRGPGGDEADPRLARRPRIAFRRVPRRRLLAYEDVAQALEVVQDVVDRQHGPAGQAEDGVHALTLQTLEQHAPACKLPCQSSLPSLLNRADVRCIRLRNSTRGILDPARIRARAEMTGLPGLTGLPSATSPSAL